MSILISEFLATPVVALFVRSFISGFVGIVAMSVIMKTTKIILRNVKDDSHHR